MISSNSSNFVMFVSVRLIWDGGWMSIIITLLREKWGFWIVKNTTSLVRIGVAVLLRVNNVVISTLVGLSLIIIRTIGQVIAVISEWTREYVASLVVCWAIWYIWSIFLSIIIGAIPAGSLVDLLYAHFIRTTRSVKNVCRIITPLCISLYLGWRFIGALFWDHRID